VKVFKKERKKKRKKKKQRYCGDFNKNSVKHVSFSQIPPKFGEIKN
jgi:hypothetical protein